MSTDKKHFLEDYKIANIHRKQIKKAPYNPRVIPEQHFKDLKSSLRKIKLREPLVWNKTTGNLISGHQRLKILDDTWQQKNKEAEFLDYTLTVVMLEINLKEEVELNLAFNNPRLMGDYDNNMMNDLLTADWLPDIDYKVAGIKDEDLEMFGIDFDLEQMQPEEVKNIMDDFEQVKAEKKASIPQDIKKQQKETVKATKNKQTENKVDTYVTVTFSSQEAKRSFMERINEQPENLFIKGEIFVKKVFGNE